LNFKLHHHRISWMEDYLHNLCAFPKAAHDDDMDSTSQALIYMRSRLGGGIVEFYRQQASGELAQPLSQRRTHRAVLESASSPSSTIDESMLARNVVEAVAQGSQIQCNAKQYPEIRQALVGAAERKIDSQDEAFPLLALSEIERLDLLFVNGAD
jgi:hypothetical protein